MSSHEPLNCACRVCEEGEVHFCSAHAAAPEMLEALKALLREAPKRDPNYGICMCRLHDRAGWCWHERARLAIAKAEGRES